MKPAEALAKRVIESVEPGARMIYREDQRIRTHDFNLHRKAGTVAAVEVTSVTDGVVKWRSISRETPSGRLCDCRQPRETRSKAKQDLEVQWLPRRS